MWTWKAGMKATLVFIPPKSGVWENGEVEIPGPKWKEVVTVEGVTDCGSEGIGLSFVEYPIPVPAKFPSFAARYFRPVVSKTLEEDRELFRKIADSPPAKGREVEREYSNPRVGV